MGMIFLRANSEKIFCVSSYCALRENKSGKGSLHVFYARNKPNVKWKTFMQTHREVKECGIPHILIVQNTIFYDSFLKDTS